MLRGLYAAATGMMALEERQAVLSNNIANVATPGFRRQAPVQKGFYDVFATELTKPFHFNIKKAPGGGVQLEETYTNLANGTLTTTGDPLHVALQGPGFIAVNTESGEKFTRSGKFTIGQDGQLCTIDGDTIQNADGGTIDVRGTDIEIARDGSVFVDNVQQGRIRIVEFEDPHMLGRQGHTLYTASDEAVEKSAEGVNTNVVHHALEMSNVNLPNEMVNLMMGLRAYEANQRVINTVDDTMSRLIEQVGMPQ